MKRVALILGLAALFAPAAHAGPEPHPSAKKAHVNWTYSYYDVDVRSGIALECFVRPRGKRYCVPATDLWLRRG